MIINVKTSKPATTEPAAAHPYKFGDEPKGSRWPFAIATALMGIALYIKSMFPGLGRAEAEPLPEQGPDDEPGRPEGPREAALPPEAETQDASDDEEEPEAGATAFGNGPEGVHMSAPFETNVSPELQLMDFDSFGAGPFDFSVGLMAANDNPARGQASAGRAGPGDSDGDGSRGPTVPDDDDRPAEDEEVNRAPRVSSSVHLVDVVGCSIAFIGLSDLLAHATDPDGDTLSIRNISVSSGSLTTSQGGWLFDAAGYGPVSVTYEITDGQFRVAQTAHFNVVRNSLAGTPADDLLVGSECGDDIDGGDGHDNIDARGGNDTVLGGYGDDYIVAGAGGDTVFAGHGYDTVFGGAGDDWISGGGGNDRLFGEGGDDTLFGDDGDDHLSGGNGDDLLVGGMNEDYLAGDDGNDRLLGGHGDDELTGGSGDDVVLGEAGSDLLEGGAGDDTMSGGDGADQVHAGDGTDLLTGDLDGADDSYDGGGGFDTLSYAAARQAVRVDLHEGVAEGEEIGVDQVRSIEAVEAGAGDDELSGSDSDDALAGNQGDDRISGAGGGDLIEGGEGHDTVSGGDGEDVVLAGPGDDCVIGDLDGADDILDGGAGMDTIDYSAATASISFDLVSGTVTGVEIGEDTISSFEVFVGGDCEDHFKAQGSGGTFHGGGGNDVFEFTALSDAGQHVSYEIQDFMAGDRIKVSRYEIFETVMDSLEDQFADTYGDNVDEDDLPILIRHEYTGNVRRTLIEADLDNDQFYELAISISGDKQITVSETA